MDFTAAVIATGFVGYALVSRRLDRSPVTGTIVFTALGLVIGPELLGLADLSGLAGEPEVVRLVLVATLVVVLFSDASAINSAPWHDDVIPARMLGIGLPAMIAIGWVGAALVLDGLEFWEAAVLATMLAPTDAALGKAVVSNPRVPRRIRQALNVESGLNDGIALPVFVVFVEAAIVTEENLPFGDLAGRVAATGRHRPRGRRRGRLGRRPSPSPRPAASDRRRETGCRSGWSPSPPPPTPSPTRSAGRGSSPPGSPGSSSGTCTTIGGTRRTPLHEFAERPAPGSPWRASCCSASTSARCWRT
jgi:hypothetical protein